MEIINLDTREKQNAFMNSARQDILRLLQLAGRPMTPKELSDKMGISASSVTFHIKKLVELGVVALDHTEQIRGITARYYRPLNVSVRLGLLAPGGDGAAQDMFLHRTVEQVLAGVQGLKRLAEEKALGEEDMMGLGDMHSGVVYLTREEAVELQRRMMEFLHEKEALRPGAQAYEYVLMAYNAAEVPVDAG